MYDVVIIGAGPAGLTAAIYTCRAGLKTLVLEAAMAGGNAGITDWIDNYPGFPEGVSGSELMMNFMAQAERYGAQIKYEEVKRIIPGADQNTVITDQNHYPARAIIIAAGARRRELQVDGEKEFMGRGVSYCATCDGAFFSGAPVAVVGGGDSAVKEALYLADIASKVYLVHRREEFRAGKILVDRMLAHDTIELKLNYVVSRILGNEQGMQGLVMKNTRTGAEEELAVEGVFVSVGLVPATAFSLEVLEHQDGYILTDNNLMTSVQGIFAAGDIRSKGVRQVATAVGDGAQAGVAVTEYLKE